jgi:hypothetical protein
MQDVSVLSLARQRLNLFAAINGNAQARIIATLFYFTVLVPFAVIARLAGDPLARHNTARWLERAPISNDLDSAQQQG